MRGRPGGGGMGDRGVRTSLLPYHALPFPLPLSSASLNHKQVYYFTRSTCKHVFLPKHKFLFACLLEREDVKCKSNILSMGSCF